MACGTPVSYLFDVCGLTEEPTCFLLGDAMTGRLADRKDPVALGTDTVLAFVTDKIRKRACINCGRCIERCPKMLYPTEIARALEAKEYELLLRQNAVACSGCGVCSYVCPVGIDLTVKTRRAVRQVHRLLGGGRAGEGSADAAKRRARGRIGAGFERLRTGRFIGPGFL